jgi:hypothetical protein
MSHLTEEQLVEHYFAEGANRVVAETHLRICSRCEQVYEEISNALAVRAPEPPAREPGYGNNSGSPLRRRCGPTRQVSQAPLLFMASPGVRRRLPARTCRGIPWGSLWQRAHTHPSQAANPAQAKERVVLFILDDHLDRSERLLVELNHAGGEKATWTTRSRMTRSRPKPSNCCRTTGSTARRSPAEAIP